MRNVVIIGAGPAGLTAAIYAGRYQLEPLVLAGQAVGGQLATISEIENYPGFPEGTDGPTLALQMQQQAERFGAEILTETATGVDLSRAPLEIKTSTSAIEASVVILAPGASRRQLRVPGENEFLGKGVSYCATCDGFFFRGKTVAVVGGGNSAAEECLVLTRFAEKVYLIHRRDQLRADQVLQQRVLANPKVEVIWNTTVDEIIGEQTVKAVRLHNRATDERGELPVEGVFIYVGNDPNTAFLQDSGLLNEHGYIIADKLGRTSIPGVFAAGVAVEDTPDQIVVAAGSGAMAAIAAEEFLSEQQDRARPAKERDLVKDA